MYGITPSEPRGKAVPHPDRHSTAARGATMPISSKSNATPRGKELKPFVPTDRIAKARISVMNLRFTSYAKKGNYPTRGGAVQHIRAVATGAIMRPWPANPAWTCPESLSTSCSAATTACLAFWMTGTARYLHLLGEALPATDVQMHACALMDNHAHLLVTPPEMGAVGRRMKMRGRNYVAQFNARHRRTGTLWEGRYKCCLVAGADYFVRCARYIDLNPVRARMTDDPTVFPWSSCAALCGMREDPLLRLHPIQHALGATKKDHGDAYRAILRDAVN